MMANKFLRMRMPLLRYLPTFMDARGYMTMGDVRNEMKKVAEAPSYFGGIEASSLPDYNVNHQDELPKRKMRDSFSEAVIPLKDNPDLQLLYASFMKTLRFGRLLEDLDTFAVWLCIRHTRGDVKGDWKLPFAIVTAQVDQIKVTPDEVMKADSDIHLSGMVTWVGRSSVESTVYVEQDSKKFMEAKFVLVTRQLTKNKSAIVNGLELETDEDRAIFQLGKEAHDVRIQESARSLLKMVPEGEEVADIHQMFLETIDPNSASFQSRVKPEGSVWMEDTILKSAVMCHPQEGNLYHKIFGGYLMRVSFELAWMNGLVFSSQLPRILEVDDISFLCPVPIGSVLLLSSQIGYTQDTRMQIKVRADVLNAESQKRETTNVFHFTFGVKSKVPAVIPRTYSDAMMYIDSRRHFRTSNESRNHKI